MLNDDNLLTLYLTIIQHCWKLYLREKANYQGMTTDMSALSSAFFKSAPDRNTVEHNWKQFKSAFHDFMNKHIPTKLWKTSIIMPRITTNIRRLLRKRNRVYSRAKQSGKADLWTLFRQLRAATKKELKTSYHSYINNMIGSLEESSKPFWRYISSRKGHSQSIQSHQKNDNKVTAPHEMAEVLNAQFQSVFKTECQESCPYVKRIAPVVPDLVITEPGINKLLGALKIGKAAGVDNLPTRPLKECADSISQVLTFIFNQTLADGKFLDDWRSTNITPFFKK